MKTLTGKLALASGMLVWLTGCASVGPPEPPSLELPRAPSDLRAARKGDRVTLTWTIPARTTDRQTVRFLGKTEICRSLDATLKQCGTPVGEAAPPADFASAGKTPAKKVTATYTDTLPAAIEQQHPTGYVTYAVEVLNPAGRGAGVSNQARVALVPTLRPFSSFTAKATGQGVLLSWHCPAEWGERAGAKYFWRIYRHPESGGAETRIAQIDVTDCAAATSFVDQTFEWENNYFYRGTVVSVSEEAGKAAVEVEGDDTPEVKVFAHDVFPPAVPTGLQAVFSGPGQQAFIDLIWAPASDTDLEGYNVYRHEEGGAAVKVNADPVKTPAFRDTQVMAGRTYFYSVSAVDQRGNESARSEESSESVP
jgi:hypothetical protein